MLSIGILFDVARVVDQEGQT